MHAAAHAHGHQITSGVALTRIALSATLHCLTGCAIGAVLGMIIGTAPGCSNLGTIVFAVALAFLFGYALTSLPLLPAALALSAVVPIAFVFGPGTLLAAALDADVTVHGAVIGSAGIIGPS